MATDAVGVAVARLERAIARRRAIVGTVHDDDGARFLYDLDRVHAFVHGHDDRPDDGHDDGADDGHDGCIDDEYYVGAGSLVARWTGRTVGGGVVAGGCRGARCWCGHGEGALA